MDKFQSIQGFWSSFGLIAYDEQTVPDDASMPYITYEAIAGSLGDRLSASASLWYRSTSWAGISRKALEIEKRLKENGFITVRTDTGLMFVSAGSIFAQRADGTEDNVRKIILSINIEFLTAF